MATGVSLSIRPGQDASRAAGEEGPRGAPTLATLSWARGPGATAAHAACSAPTRGRAPPERVSVCAAAGRFWGSKQRPRRTRSLHTTGHMGGPCPSSRALAAQLCTPKRTAPGAPNLQGSPRNPEFAPTHSSLPAFVAGVSSGFRRPLPGTMIRWRARCPATRRLGRLPEGRGSARKPRYLLSLITATRPGRRRAGGSPRPPGWRVVNVKARGRPGPPTAPRPGAARLAGSLNASPWP